VAKRLDGSRCHLVRRSPRRHCVESGPSWHSRRQFSAHINCTQTAGCITIPLGTEVGLSPGDIVLDGDPAPPPPKKNGHSPHPIFGPCLLWPNGCMDQDATWCGGKPLPRRRFVRWGLSSSPKKEHSPQFSAHVYCGQPAGWMKMPLGTKVDLGPGHIMLDGDPSPPTKEAQQPPPLFGECLLWPRSPFSATAELL